MNIDYDKNIWSLDIEEAIEDLKQLEIGESCFYPESDYGHGYIVRTERGFECYSISMYGGNELFENIYDNPESAFLEVSSWT